MARSKAFNEDCVLDKAVDLFWCNGYHATSAQNLVDGLEISRSSLYDTYGDKYNLFIKALEHYSKTKTAATIKELQSIEDPEQMIRQIFKNAVKESLDDAEGKGCFMVNTAIELAPHDKKIAALVNQNLLAAEDALYAAIKKGQDNGQFSSAHNARALARFMQNSIIGIRVAARSGGDKKMYDDIVRVALGTLKMK
jgi:TetR/AcrR family transcriptional regulator, transcriptional repressor for nem operon